MIEPGVFGPDELDELSDFFALAGYATVRGLLDEDATARIEAECTAAQAALVAGELDERHGTSILIEGDAGEKDRDEVSDRAGRRVSAAFANYVTYVNELAPSVLDAVTHPLVAGLMHRWMGDAAWLMDDVRFGVVYQDARPGRESSYTRIGWHSDWQSGPNLDMWPSVAFTIHVDATSPANGFLRVVPGSHRWATPAPYRNANDAIVPDGSAPFAGHTAEPPPFEMPLGFDKVPGEVALYAERGDVLFHDAYLWHSAARATDDDTMRRHVRGGWYSGAGKPTGEHLDDFVKNAAR